MIEKSYAERAAASRKAARWTRVGAWAMFGLAALFLALFLLMGIVGGRWTFILIASVLILASSGVSMMSTAHLRDRTAQDWARLARGPRW